MHHVCGFELRAAPDADRGPEEPEEVERLGDVAPVTARPRPLVRSHVNGPIRDGLEHPELGVATARDEHGRPPVRPGADRADERELCAARRHRVV